VKRGSAGDFQDGRIGRGDDGSAALHGFEDGQSESFVEGREDEARRRSRGKGERRPRGFEEAEAGVGGDGWGVSAAASGEDEVDVMSAADIAPGFDEEGMFLRGSMCRHRESRARVGIGCGRAEEF